MNNASLNMKRFAILVILVFVIICHTNLSWAQKSKKEHPYINKYDQTLYIRDAQEARVLYSMDEMDSISTIIVHYFDSIMYYKELIKKNISKCNNAKTFYIANFRETQSYRHLLWDFLAVPIKNIDNIILIQDSCYKLNLEVLSSISNLKTIEFQMNNVVHIDSLLSQVVLLPNVKCVVFSHDFIEVIPEIGSKYGMIEALGLFDTHVSEIPCDVILNSNLKAIDVSLTKVKIIPKCILNAKRCVIIKSNFKDFYNNKNTRRTERLKRKCGYNWWTPIQ